MIEPRCTPIEEQIAFEGSPQIIVDYTFDDAPPPKVVILAASALLGSLVSLRIPAFGGQT